MICQHIAVENLLQLFALFAVSNIPLVRFQQFYGIFLTEIRCLQCLQITGIHLKHIFVSLFAGLALHITLSYSPIDVSILMLFRTVSINAAFVSSFIFIYVDSELCFLYNKGLSASFTSLKNS